MDPRDRVVMITGASMGIGEAVARAFAGAGARVVLVARTIERLKALAADLGAERALALQADLATLTERPARADELVEASLARFGRLDILVNNAAVGMYATVAGMDRRQFDSLFAVNVFVPVYLTQAAVPHMKKQGGGQIINVGSVAGKVALPWTGAYCASKFALHALTDTLRMELRPWNIHVIGIYPGPVKTPFQRNAYRGQDSPQRFLGPRGVPAEAVARAVLRASRYNLRSVMIPEVLWLFVGFHRLFPGLTDRLLARFMK